MNKQFFPLSSPLPKGRNYRRGLQVNDTRIISKVLNLPFFPSPVYKRGVTGNVKNILSI